MRIPPFVCPDVQAALEVRFAYKNLFCTLPCCCLQSDNNLSLIEYELVTIPAEHTAAAAAAQPATA